MSSQNLAVLPVDLDQDWDAYFATYWNSWRSPRQSLMVLTLPFIGEGGEKEAASFKSIKKECLDSARHTPGQYWFKLVDKNLEGKGVSPIIGGVSITHCRKGMGCKDVPEAPEKAFEPGSDLQRLAIDLHGQMTDWHVQYRETKEHLYGHGLWMLPGRRTRGGAELLVRTMTGLADKLGIEAFTEAASMSKPLLFRCGFNLLATVTPNVKCDSQDKEIQRLVQDLNSNPIAILTRPRKVKTDQPSKQAPLIQARL